jgi:hypothetical protein
MRSQLRRHGPRFHHGMYHPPPRKNSSQKAKKKTAPIIQHNNATPAHLALVERLPRTNKANATIVQMTPGYQGEYKTRRISTKYQFGNAPDAKNIQTPPLRVEILWPAVWCPAGAPPSLQRPRVLETKPQSVAANLPAPFGHRNHRMIRRRFGQT